MKIIIILYDSLRLLQWSSMCVCVCDLRSLILLSIRKQIFYNSKTRKILEKNKGLLYALTVSDFRTRLIGTHKLSLIW